MKYTLIIIYTMLGQPVGQEAIVTADDKESCELARCEFLKLPGYVPRLLRCIPGEAVRAK